MNITVRVLTRQAVAALNAFEARLKAASMTSSGLGAAPPMNMGGWARATAVVAKFGQQMQWTGYQMSRTFTVPLVAIGAALTKYELENEKAFAGVRQVYGDAELQAKQHGAVVRRELVALRKEFEALSGVYGTSQTEVIKIGEAWAAAGVSGAALGTSVENTLKTMLIGQVDYQTATKALIAIQAQYGVTSQGLTKILQTLNVVENETGATTGDLIQGFARSAGVAASAGVDYRHLAAMIAALVPAAGTASNAGNALKTIFTQLLVPTTKAQKALKQMGIDTEDTGWRSLTASQRLEILAQKFSKLSGQQRVAASNYIANKYQINRFSQLMADISRSFDKQGHLITDTTKNIGYYGKALDDTRNANKNAQIATRELNIVLQSQPQRLKQMWTILKNDGANAIKALIPFLIQLVQSLAQLFNWFNHLSPVTQKWIGIMLIGLALLGPFLLYLSGIIRLFTILNNVVMGVGKMFLWFFKLLAGGSKATATAQEEAIAATKVAEATKLETVTVSQERMTAITLEEIQKRKLAENAVIVQQEKAWTTYAANVGARERALTAERDALAQATAAAQVSAAEEALAAWNASAATIDGEYRILYGNLAAETQAYTTTATTLWQVSSAGIIEAGNVAAGSMVANAAEILAAHEASAAAVGTIWEVTSAGIVSAAAISAANFMRFWQVSGAGVVTALTAIEDSAIHAAIIEVRAAELVNGAYLQLIATLRAVQAQAEITAQRMIESNSAATAVMVRQNSAVASAGIYGATTRYVAGAGAAEAAAAGAVAGNAASSAARTTEGIFSRSLGRIATMFKSGFGAIGKFVNIALAGIPLAVGRLLIAPFAAAAGAIGAPVAAVIGIVLALVAVFLIFRHQITDASLKVWSSIKWLAKEIWGGLTSVWHFIESFVSGIIHAFAALPGAIVRVFRAVVEVVKQAALDVYHFFQYLNPFAHHSPSLVERVNDGMKVVRDQHKQTSASAQSHAQATADAHGKMSNSMKASGTFTNGTQNTDRAVQNLSSSASSVDSVVKHLVSDTKAFDNASASLLKRNEDLQRAADLKTLGKYAPQAVGKYRALGNEIDNVQKRYDSLGDRIKAQQAVVDQWQAVVDKANAALTRQQDILTKLQAIQQKYENFVSHDKDMIDHFANSTIKGMGAMDDAIFANDQAQKRLQLRMMKMEDVLGPIDDARDKLSRLQGEQSAMLALQDGLRAAGAGSDITGVYGKQAKALGEQADNTQKLLTSYDDLQSRLDKLQHTGQELDLEKSLKFDALQRQVDKLVNGTKELTFKQIIDGITKWQAEEAKNNDKLNDANKAVKDQQKNVNSAQAVVDKYQKSLDKQNKVLDTMNKRYQTLGDALQSAKDGLSGIMDAANGVKDSLDQAAKSKSKLDAKMGEGPILGTPGSLKPARGEGALGRIKGRLGGLKGIKDQTDALLKKLTDDIGSTDIFAPLKRMFSSVGAFFKKWFWEEPAKWGDWITSKVSAAGRALWGWIVTGVKAIPKGLALGWRYIWNFIKSLPGMLLRGVVTIGRNLPEIGQKIVYWIGYGLGRAVGTLVKLFPMLLGMFANFVVWAASKLASIGGSLLEKIWNGIISAVKNTPHALLVIGEAIIGGLRWAMERGIPTLIKWIFVSIPHAIVEALKGAGHWLSGTGSNIIMGLIHGLGHAVKYVWDWTVNFIKGFVKGFLSALGISSPSKVFMEIGKNILRGLLNGLLIAAKLVFAFFVKLPIWILDKLGRTALWLIGKGRDIIGSWGARNGLLGGLHNGWDAVANFFKDIPRNVIGFFARATSWLISAGRNIMGNWGSGTGLLGGIHYVWDNISQFFKDLPGKIQGFFARAGGWLYGVGKTIMQGLLDGMRAVAGFIANQVINPTLRFIGSMVNGIIGGINAFTGGINKVMDLLHLPGSWRIGTIGSWSVPQIELKAKGGTLGDAFETVGSGFKTNKPHAIVGEGGPHDEYVIPTDPRHRNRAIALFQALGKDLHFFAAGGEMGGGGGGGYSYPRGNVSIAQVNADINLSRSNVGSLISDLLNTGGTNIGGPKDRGDGLIGVGDWAAGVVKAIGGFVVSNAAKALFWPFKTAMDAVFDTVPIEWIKAMGHDFTNKVWDRLSAIGKDQDKQTAASGTPDYGFGYSVDRFAPVAYEAALDVVGHTLSSFGYVTDLLPHILRRLNQESGGDPNAINNWDINAINGTPSKGIMQVIDPTFASYANRTGKYPYDIWDPRANMFAGLNYAQSAYGSIQSAMDQPGGYARGASYFPGGVGLFGENGPEYAQLPKGSSLLTSAATLRMVSQLAERAYTRVAGNEASGGSVTRPTIVNNDNSKHVTIHIASVEFPNVKSSDDAEGFIKSLEILAESGGNS